VFCVSWVETKFAERETYEPTRQRTNFAGFGSVSLIDWGCIHALLGEFSL
jgi:hypothetical protein